MAEDESKTPQDTAASAAGSGDADLEEALSSAQTSLDEIKQQVEAERSGASRGGDGGGGGGAVGDDAGIELLSDVELDVSIELGRTEMLVEDVLRLGAGSVVELDKLAGDPVDVHVNGRLVARGEVLVLNDNFCIRISEIVADLEEQAQDAQDQFQAQAKAAG